MRIGIDCRSLQEPQPSGVSVYTREVLSAMLQLPEARQHEFILFANVYGSEVEKKRIDEAKKRFQGENIEWRVGVVPNKLLTAAEVVVSRPQIDWMFGEVDAVFVPNIHFFPVTDTSVPLVLTVHDLSFKRYPECLGLKGRWRHRLLKPRAFCERAEKILTVSEHTKSDVESLYKVAPEKVETVYPGVRTAFDDGARPSSQLNLPDKYILSLATVEPRKNIEALLKAFDMIQKDHPDVELVIAGGAAWKSKRTLKRISEMSGVQYLGYVDQQEKLQLLKNAEMFVYPSLYEGFGFPPLEAQAVGTPVLVGAHSSLPEVLGESALFADILDARSIARGIHHLLGDPELRERLVQRGQENVRRFTWQTTAKLTFDAIMNIV